MRKPTKAHIICHLLATHGPMGRADLLRLTAEVEGKPYKPTSNASYFVPFAKGNSPYYTAADYARMQKSSLVGNGYIAAVGKQGNALVYNNTPKGAAKAAEYAEWLSMRP